MNIRVLINIYRIIAIVLIPWLKDGFILFYDTFTSAVVLEVIVFYIIFGIFFIYLLANFIILVRYVVKLTTFKIDVYKTLPVLLYKKIDTSLFNALVVVTIGVLIKVIVFDNESSSRWTSFLFYNLVFTIILISEYSTLNTRFEQAKYEEATKKDLML